MSGRWVASTRTIPAAGPFLASQVSSSPMYWPAGIILPCTLMGVRSSRGTCTSSMKIPVIGMFSAGSRDIAGVTFDSGQMSLSRSRMRR